MMDSMEAPKKAPKKKKKIKPNYSLSHDQSLPNDIIITILAKLPRSNYPSLSLVSKNFRSLIRSKYLYTIRSSLGTTENTVFVCLKLPGNEKFRWYSLRTNVDRSQHLLRRIKHSYDRVFTTSVAFLDSVGYVIGGNNKFSCTVKRISRKTSTLLPENAPNMNVARKNAVVCQFKDKIYVMGGCNDTETTNWAEVFDKKTQTWKSFKCPDVLRRYKIYKMNGLDSKLYVWTDTKDYSYDVNEDKWEVLEERLSRSKTWCVVDKIVYRLDHFEGFTWFDSQFGIWRKVEGRLSKLKYMYGTMTGNKGKIEMIEHDKKLLVFWEWFERSGIKSKKIIWCAKISLKKEYGSIKGNIEWIDIVLKPPITYDFVTCLCKQV